MYILRGGTQAHPMRHIGRAMESKPLEGFLRNECLDFVDLPWRMIRVRVRVSWVRELRVLGRQS